MKNGTRRLVFSSGCFLTFAVAGKKYLNHLYN